MADNTRIGWTDATVNFTIGCQHAGPGCDSCYAAAFALRQWGIIFGPSGERRPTIGAFKDPLIWQKQHEEGRTIRKRAGILHRTPLWVFACSLSDFFDNKWPPGVRDRAWKVIRDTPTLRWQIVTKRVGNVLDMLPADWNGGIGYEHVGIICTMVNQVEINRDLPKLIELKSHGVKWVGISIEPQLGAVTLSGGGQNVDLVPMLDWVITGGESKQGGREPRPYDLHWAYMLVGECRDAGIPIFVKQMGSNALLNGKRVKFKDAGTQVSEWPEQLRIQQMPTIYPDVAPIAPDLLESAKQAEPSPQGSLL